MAEVLREEFFQAGIIQPARVELRGGLRWGNRVRFKMSAAGDGDNAAQERPNFQAGRHALKLLGDKATDQNFEAAGGQN